MSLMNESGSNGMVMPVGPMMGGGYGMDGLAGGSGWFWLLIIFVFGMFSGNWGFGGFGGNGGAVNTVNNDIQRGFDQQAVMGGLNGITSAVNGLGMQMCQGFNAAESAAAAREMASMNQNFANQQALQAQLNTIAMNQQQCCCENRAAVADLKYNIATEGCNDRQVVSDAMMAISNKIDALGNQMTVMNYQNQLGQKDNIISQKDDIIAQLRSEALYNRGQASQDIQTATIQAGQRNLANEVEQYVAPRAIPAYLMPNPNCCQQNSGCGCGNRFVA